jgi:hypothetical protein
MERISGGGADSGGIAFTPGERNSRTVEIKIDRTDFERNGTRGTSDCEIDIRVKARDPEKAFRVLEGLF